MNAETATISAKGDRPPMISRTLSLPYAFSPKRAMKREALAWARQATGQPALRWKAARKLLKKAKAG
jgi:hypothetical protein